MDVSIKSPEAKTMKPLKQGVAPTTTHHNGDLEQMTEEGDENMMITLPKEVMRRVNALKNIQLKMVDVETKFYEELHLLECKYAKMYEGFYQQREKIVNGEHEPSEEEAKFALDSADELADQLKDKAKLDEQKDANSESEDPVKGSTLKKIYFYFIFYSLI